MDKKTNRRQSRSGVEKMTFENALSELETLLSNIEKGSLTLDASLHAYKKGVSLITHCQAELNRVEQTFSELSKSISCTNESEDSDH